MQETTKSTMIPILLFSKGTWTREQVEMLLKERGIAYRLRFGFSNIIALCDESIDFRAPPSAEPYLCVWHDVDSHLVSNKCILVDENGPTARDTQELLDSWENVKFDLTNFGFLPQPAKEGTSTLDALKVSVDSLGSSVELSMVPVAEPVLARADLSLEVKKFIIDLVALHSTAMLVITKLWDRKDTLTQYASVFILSFVTRSEIEKLMLLVAAIDPAMDLSKLERSKRVRRVFQAEVVKSDWDITRTLAQFVPNVSLLDDNYRSPEVHKRGRLLALVQGGHFGSLINEVLSFQNEAQGIFREICKSLTEREKPTNPST